VIAAEVQRCLDAEIRPLLHVHGGDVELVGVDDGIVELAFLSACRGCHFKAWTMLIVIESRLLRVDGVHEVRAQGVNVSRQARERTRALFESA
jgi:Fe-S cluster biogenesis protein NfuA